VHRAGLSGQLVEPPLVLAYHAISDAWPCTLATSPLRLEGQLRALLAKGYTPVTFADAISGDVARKTLAVTFDDAYRSVIELAFPIMRDLGVPGTVYAPTGFVGSDEPMEWPGIEQWKGGEHEAELLCMTWPHLERLAGAGWEIGSHTRTHPKLSRLADEALAAELSSSRTVLAERVGDGRTIAYPYGDSDRRVHAAAREAGYEAAAGVRPGPSNRWNWPRVGVYPADDERRFKIKVNPVVRRARGSLLGGAVYRARQVS
jgi:peptidoglycan/xylan/chitin deacetylase (PgdA/CDA1 family)